LNLPRNKTLSAIALVLMLTFTIFMASMPAVNAADIAPVAYLSVVPNPVGVNQPANVIMWLQPIPPTASDVFHGFMVTITKPDGTTETRGPLTTSLIGSQGFSYTPTIVGTYKFQFAYPGETFASTGDNYLSSQSQVIELVVQQQQIEEFSETSIPTGYWTRPISGEERSWYSISGNWLMRAYSSAYASFDAPGAYNPYSQAPLSPHIMWTKELTMGGLVGGEFGSIGYYAGLSYEWKVDPPIIINGKLYYNLWPSRGRGIYGYGGPNDLPVGITGFICVDVRTGQELWRKDTGVITHGQIYNYESGNQGGAMAYLWEIASPTYQMYDAFTGDWMMNFTNAAGGLVTYGSDGTMFVYVLGDGWLAMWNSTKAFDENGQIAYGPVGMWRPHQGTYDWTKGLEWNTTVPKAPAGNYAMQTCISDNVLVATMGPSYTVTNLIVGYSTITGQQLWVINRRFNSNYKAVGEGIYAQFEATTRTWLAYNINTGQQLWESEPMGYPWGTYLSENPLIAYDKLWTMGFDGYIHAIDINTGKDAWKFYSGNSGYETPYGTYPFWNGPLIASGVVFAGTGEHSPTQPIIRGEKLFAVDANTGQGLWNINGLLHTDAIADGYLIAYNAYDNRIYCFGKGPSAATVSAPQVAVPKGTAITITGSVTDQSEGQKGTPAISDESMSQWMEYLVMQKAYPANVKGVPVALTAIGPDGNVNVIGTGGSEASGKYGFAWTPQSEGTYKITATFKGSYSYGSSFDETFVTVSGVSSSSETTNASAAPIDLYIIVATILVIIAIAVAVIILRKR
jgi:outer membrane protein assembly factor BamB